MTFRHDGTSSVPGFFSSSRWLFHLSQNLWMFLKINNILENEESTAMISDSQCGIFKHFIFILPEVFYVFEIKKITWDELPSCLAAVSCINDQLHLPTSKNRFVLSKVLGFELEIMMNKTVALFNLFLLIWEDSKTNITILFITQSNKCTRKNTK